MGGEDFEQWVGDVVALRNERIAEKRNLYVELDPVIAEAFANSQAISRKCIYCSTLRRHTKSDSFLFKFIVDLGQIC